jgi:hypothetical protein
VSCLHGIENDLNIAWNVPNDYSERWEGIISAPSTEPGFEMPQVGGPNCGPFNKRYELVLDPSGPNEFYFNPADHRIHIKDSDKTWIKVDYDGDMKADMNDYWMDSNHDGVMDRQEVDVDGDDRVDDGWESEKAAFRFYDGHSDFTKMPEKRLTVSPKRRCNMERRKT